VEKNSFEIHNIVYVHSVTLFKNGYFLVSIYMYLLLTHMQYSTCKQVFIIFDKM